MVCPLFGYLLAKRRFSRSLGLPLVFLLGAVSFQSAKLYSHLDQQIKYKEKLNTVYEYAERGNYKKALELVKEIKAGEEDADSLKKVISEMENSVLKKGITSRLFDEKFCARWQLLNLLGIVGRENRNPDIAKINAWAQKNLLRRGERWHQQTDRFHKLARRILPILGDLGFIHEIEPSFSTYEGAILHGALVSTVRFRLHYLIEKWNQGIRFKNLYFLGGERPLDQEKENEKALFSDEHTALKFRRNWKIPKELPKTEFEMKQLVWEQSEIPKSMRESVTAHFINAPLIEDPKTGKKVRPTTESSIEAFFETNPMKGRYLAVSHAPYTPRQDLLIKTLSPEEYDFDTVGNKASGELKEITYLDELARTIYVIYQSFLKKLALKL